jgi:hypothetical protein
MQPRKTPNVTFHYIVKISLSMALINYKYLFQNTVIKLNERRTNNKKNLYRLQLVFSNMQITLQSRYIFTNCHEDFLSRAEKQQKFPLKSNCFLFYNCYFTPSCSTLTNPRADCAPIFFAILCRRWADKLNHTSV